MRRLALILAATAAASAAQAAQYEFTPAPQTDLNRIYRVDRFSGEVTACQYGLREGSIGVTLCYGAGEGAGVQAGGDYSLVASHHQREGGIFRVNQRSGEISVCYVFDERVVCTPPAKAAPIQQSQTTPADAAANIASAQGAASRKN
ncbi:hypothetical protein [Terrarubrum flagellatum]|uniref:hypothetical protein n=1 Tax=Terrirubrum flagellatum TaxID=2895980 RepID=UPI003144E523